MNISIFVMNIFLCASYLKAATISAYSRYLRRLFEGGYYSKCGVYSRKTVYVHVQCIYIEYVQYVGACCISGIRMGRVSEAGLFLFFLLRILHRLLEYTDTQ